MRTTKFDVTETVEVDKGHTTTRVICPVTLGELGTLEIHHLRPGYARPDTSLFTLSPSEMVTLAIQLTTLAQMLEEEQAVQKDLMARHDKSMAAWEAS